MTPQEWLEQHGVTVLVGPGQYEERTPYDVDGHSWPHYSHRVTIKGPGGVMHFIYRAGTGFLGEPPRPEGVLENLAADAAHTMPGNVLPFEEWANELGYDPDSRQAERTYRDVVRQTRRLARVVGDDALEQLAFVVDFG